MFLFPIFILLYLIWGGTDRHHDIELTTMGSFVCLFFFSAEIIIKNYVVTHSGLIYHISAVLILCNILVVCSLKLILYFLEAEFAQEHFI